MTDNEATKGNLVILSNSMRDSAGCHAREAATIACQPCDMTDGDRETLLAEVYAACSVLCAAASKLREIAARLRK